MRKANPHLNGLVITGYERGVDRRALEQVGIVGAIRKPFDMDTLIAAPSTRQWTRVCRADRRSRAGKR